MTEEIIKCFSFLSFYRRYRSKLIAQGFKNYECVCVRERDSMAQERVPTEGLERYIGEKLGAF